MVLGFLASGTVSPLILDEVAEQSGAFLSATVEVLGPFDPPSEAFNALRRQHHAGMILEKLAALHPELLRVIGITSYDLFLPIFTHVYGEAQMPGRAAVVSFFRIGPSEEEPPLDHAAFLQRALKVIIHEILHTFGLAHCRHSACLMRSVTRIPDLDNLPLQLCRSCRHLWEASFKDSQPKPATEQMG
jgi:archaemetzincin